MMQWIRTSWAGGATQLLVGVVLACALSTAAWADDQAGASSVPVEVAARSADEADPGHLAEAAAASVATGSMVRGIIRASSIATISAEINARIVSLPFRDGDRFQKGDVLAAFDCKRLDAEYAAGVADYKAHKLAYENQQRLSGYQAAGMASVEQAQYEAEKAAVLVAVDGRVEVEHGRALEHARGGAGVRDALRRTPELGGREGQRPLGDEPPPEGDGGRGRSGDDRQPPEAHGRVQARGDGVEEGARCACGLSSGCCRCRAATLRFGRPMVRAVHTGASVLHRSHFPCAIRHLPLTPSDYAA